MAEFRKCVLHERLAAGYPRLPVHRSAWWPFEPAYIVHLVPDPG